MTLTPVSSLKGKDIAAAAQFSRGEIDALCALALEIRKKIESGEVVDVLRGRIMTPIFYESSSRTFSSFCAAMLRLGGNVVHFDVGSSSVNKGESLQDTIRTLDSYSDVLVLRHPSETALSEASGVASCPIMNAGNGAGEHPSQALLDVLTMVSELGTVYGATITLIGDLKMGRTVHSLLKLLIRNFDIKAVYLIAPNELQMPKDVLESIEAEVQKRGITITALPALSDEVVGQSDVLYVTRLQKERFLSSTTDADALAAFDAAKAGLCVDAARLKSAKEKMIVLHPLPRNDELSTDVDDDPRAAYFRQMKYGLYMRMALLMSVLS